ncbi:hypothetical protein UNDKW_1122 [Undibacterium sp. KW1]|uniref:hypothetical protein n=1 Tax=Undibacterium sp. KW1 TaxID=2058624 RepID=UPI001331E8FD|nr:hypothetical protein [Undibacterium sp. KW1]BBB59395.1 hypothetical protein UNDKW_1122 [Undibacterium sp. KW1]
MAIKTILNVSALAGVKITSRLIGYTAFGVFLNLVLLLFFTSWAGRGHSGLPLLVLCVVTLLAPILYFLMGKKQGIAAALHFLAERHGSDLSQFVVSKLTDNYPQLLDKAHSAGSTSAVIHEKISAQLNKMSEQSTVNKMVFGTLLQKFDFISVISRVLENNPAAGSESREETADRIARALQEKLNANDLKPDLQAPARLVAGNVAAALFCASILPVIFR